MILRSVATLLHNTAMRINRRIARPVLGQFFDTRSYDNIRKAFRADTATLSDLTVDADDARAAGILDRHGIVILRNAIDPALADAARHEADAMAARLASGQLFIHGWVYDIETSQIKAYDAEVGHFRPLDGEGPMPMATPRPRYSQS